MTFPEDITIGSASRWLITQSSPTYNDPCLSLIKSNLVTQREHQKIGFYVVPNFAPAPAANILLAPFSSQHLRTAIKPIFRRPNVSVLFIWASLKKLILFNAKWILQVQMQDRKRWTVINSSGSFCRLCDYCSRYVDGLISERLASRQPPGWAHIAFTAPRLAPIEFLASKPNAISWRASL